LLKELLDSYNDGHAKSFYCRAVTLLNIDDIEKAISNIDITDNINIKMKAKIMRLLIMEIANKKHIDLNLRK
jgi:hypothetical protein